MSVRPLVGPSVGWNLTERSLVVGNHPQSFVFRKKLLLLVNSVKL